MATILQTPPEPGDDGRAAEPSGSWRDYLGYFRSRSFLLTLVGVAVAAVVVFLALDWGLGWYTNHGQRLQVDDYVGLTTADATDEIEGASFRAEVSDSVFLVDEPPGIVLRQDPPAGAYVKENRRIYLTVTKTIPDEVTLPGLAGTYDFDRYNRKLAMLDVRGRVRDREFSSRYQPNTILKVYYAGEEISEAQLKRGFQVPKGAELEFTVTTSSGGTAELPDLRCRTLDEARLFLQSYRLRVGRLRADDSVDDPETAYVWRQEPEYAPGARVPLDSELTLFLTEAQPADCEEL